jgi:rhamnosyltransferase
MSRLRVVRDAHGSTPAVSAVVPVLDAGPRLMTLLDALHGQDVGPVEVLLVDSGSRDGMVDEAARRWPALRLFAVDRGAFDHGIVRTEAALRARAPLVACFSQDAVPLGAGMLRALAAPFEDPAVAGAMARQVPRPGADPGVVATLRRWTPPGDGPIVRGAAEGGGPAARMEAARFDNVGSMVRRSVLEAIPFPSRAFGEDIAWGDAVLAAGHLLAYVPGALVEHHHDAGLRQTFRRHRASHEQAAREFGLRAVPSLLALPGAILGGLAADALDGGPGWAVRAAPRRAAALLGQWAGARRVHA